MKYREPSDIEIFTWDKGTVIRDYLLIAKQRLEDKSRDRIVAIGRATQTICQEDTYVCNPFRNGIIDEWEDSVQLIKYYVNKACKPKLFRKVKVAVCMLPGATGIEKKAMEEAMFLAGAKKVFLTELTREEFTRKEESKEYDLIISIGQNFRG